LCPEGLFDDGKVYVGFNEGDAKAGSRCTESDLAIGHDQGVGRSKCRLDLSGRGDRLLHAGDRGLGLVAPLPNGRSLAWEAIQLSGGPKRSVLKGALHQYLSPRFHSALASSSCCLNGFDVLVEPSANPRTVFPNSINSASVMLRSRSRNFWRIASSDSNPIMCRSGRSNGRPDFASVF
jgi:hypothetical protein